MTEFPIPESAERLLHATADEDSPGVGEQAGGGSASLPASPRAKVGGYTGFVCAECRARVDYKLRGDHKPGCSNELHNQGLQPWREE